MTAPVLAKRLELWPTARLVPYARNARTHDDAQVAKIAASIREFGFTNPILVDSRDGIVAGHGRLAAALLLELAEVPVVVLDHLTEAQRRAYVLADNRLALDAGWDDAILADELAALEDDGFDLALTGFTDAEIERLLIEDGGEGAGMPELPTAERGPFQQMTFSLHDDQAEQVRVALERAKSMGDFEGPNENSNGNALARVCEIFITQNGVDRA